MCEWPGLPSVLVRGQAGSEGSCPAYFSIPVIKQHKQDNSQKNVFRAYLFRRGVHGCHRGENDSMQECRWHWSSGRELTYTPTTIRELTRNLVGF